MVTSIPGRQTWSLQTFIEYPTICKAPGWAYHPQRAYCLSEKAEGKKKKKKKKKKITNNLLIRIVQSPAKNRIVHSPAKSQLPWRKR